MSTPGDEGSVLVIRAWQERQVRARLLGEQGDRHTEAVAEGVEDICAAVRAWLCPQDHDEYHDHDRAGTGEDDPLRP